MGDGRQVILQEFENTAAFGNSQPEARIHLLTIFFSAGQVDASYYAYRPLNFGVGVGLAGMAKLLLGIAVLVIVL